MDTKTIFENLCYHDLRNPNFYQNGYGQVMHNGSCFCDNCRNGCTVLAEALLVQAGADRLEARIAKELVREEIPWFKNTPMYERIDVELLRARKKFPDPAGSMVALTEEVGELAKALLDEPWPRVVEEAVQVAVMAIRVATEGDPTLVKLRERRKVSNEQAPR